MGFFGFALIVIVVVAAADAMAAAVVGFVKLLIAIYRHRQARYVTAFLAICITLAYLTRPLTGLPDTRESITAIAAFFAGIGSIAIAIYLKRKGNK